MAEVTSIALKGVPPAKGLEFIKAEWWDDASRFVIVYARTPMGPEKPLRMDVNKRAFLDYFGDEALDVSLQARAEAVWSVVAEKKRAVARARVLSS